MAHSVDELDVLVRQLQGELGGHISDFIRTLFNDPDAATARSTLGLGSAATLNSPVPVANGGTGATSKSGALTNLGLAWGNVALTWPGGNVIAGPQTVTHGLGGTPNIVIATPANVYDWVSYYVDAETSTTFTLHARALTVTPPAASQLLMFWLAF